MQHGSEGLVAGVDGAWLGRTRLVYGSAVEVLDLLRGLTDAGPAVRATALDAMYGGIRRRGDVFAGQR